MKQQELIEKLEDYLKGRNAIFVENSIEYIGIRENYVISDKDPKDYHFLSYEAVADKENIYSTQSYFVLIDKVTEKISYLLGPQSSETIEE